MSVLITGGAGYIGSHTVLELRRRCEAVVVLDNLSTGFAWTVPSDVPLILGDFGDIETLVSLLKTHEVEAIIHFAARTVVTESVSDPLGYYLANTVKSRALFAAAALAGVRHIIFSSTAAVYGATGSKPVSENDPTVPLSPYGSSKLMTEWILRDVCAAHPMRYVILRYFNVAGADPEGRIGQSTSRATHLIKVAVQTALGLRPFMELYGQDYNTPDGTCIRDYIHVSDLASAHALALEYMRGGGQSILVNAGYGRGFSVREVIETTEIVSGLPINIQYAPRRAGDAPSVVAEPNILCTQLGWKPQYDDLSTIVLHALKWERELVLRGLTPSPF